MGRETKLNPDVQKRICDTLRDGNTRRVAAILGGIGESTFYDWMDWAKPDHENHKEIYSEFSEAVTRAESEAEAEHVKNIQLQGIGDWRASVEYLKRRNPRDWSEKIQTQQTNLNIDVSDLTDDQLDRLANGEDPATVLKSKD